MSPIRRLKRLVARAAVRRRRKAVIPLSEKPRFVLHAKTIGGATLNIPRIREAIQILRRVHRSYIELMNRAKKSGNKHLENLLENEDKSTLHDINRLVRTIQRLQKLAKEKPKEKKHSGIIVEPDHILDSISRQLHLTKGKKPHKK